ncbi:GTPase HflX [Hydrogenobaculum acidophilum]
MIKAISVGLQHRNQTREQVLESLEELEGLIDAIGGKSIGYLVKRKDFPDASTLVGVSYLNLIKELVEGTGSNAVVFDEFLTPSQVRNIEAILGVDVLDRANVVFEIFMKRAKTQQAKLQIELAKLTYELPRLYGVGAKLSRQSGKMGTRGPGEQLVEIKRRAIQKRIHKIREEIEQIKKHHKEQRKNRFKTNNLKVALVGYTNAGKSSLMKALTKKDVFISDMLFATLDTKVGTGFVDGEKIFITDTVGFIDRLPPELVESFKTTLEEVVLADLLLFVVDISDNRWLHKINTVEKILQDIGAHEKPVLYVFNKIDKIVSSKEQIALFEKSFFFEKPYIFVSSERDWNVDALLERMKSYYKSHINLTYIYA